MKCRTVMAWLDEHDIEDGAPEWSAMLMHARQCADCAQVLADHRLLKKMLHTLPEPTLPPRLHAVIMQAIDSDQEKDFLPSGEEDWLSLVFTRWVRPIGFAMTTACLVAGVGLFLRVHEASSPALTTPLSPTHLARTARPVPLPSLRSREQKDNRLTAVSQEEVREFMRKMRDFRRLHPEIQSSTDVAPEVELAGYNLTGGSPR